MHIGPASGQNMQYITSGGGTTHGQHVDVLAPTQAASEPILGRHSCGVKIQAVAAETIASKVQQCMQLVMLQHGAGELASH